VNQKLTIHGTVKRRGQSLARAVAVLALAVALGGSFRTPARAASSGSGGIPSIQHLFLIMMENTSYDSLIGNANAPWTNKAARTYGVSTNYYGVTHPSQPNYIALTSGSTNGVANGNDVNVRSANLVDQLEGEGITWKAYMQSLNAGGNTDLLAHAAGNQLYVRQHNPFVSYTDVQNNSARMANIVDFTHLSDDLASGTVPQFAWISPDQCHDMHGLALTPSDPCDFSHEQSIIGLGDRFLQSTVDQIMASSAWTDRSYIVVVWDESDLPFEDTSSCCHVAKGGGHALALVISHDNPTPRSSSVPYNHYSLLATIEAAWQLGCLQHTCDYGAVNPMSDLFS